MKLALAIEDTFIHDKTGQQRTAKLKVYDKGDYIQLWVNNGHAGHAGIRLSKDKLAQLKEWLG